MGVAPPGVRRSFAPARKSCGGTRCSTALIGGEHDERAPVARLDGGELGQRGDAMRHRLGIGRDPVIGNAVPGGKAQAPHVGREEGKRVFEHGDALPVAGDMQDGFMPLASGRGAGKLTEQRRIQSFRHAARDAARAFEQGLDFEQRGFFCLGHDVRVRR